MSRNAATAWYARCSAEASTDRLCELDRAYASRCPFLSADQLLRWNLVGDELGRRQGAVVAGSIFEAAMAEAV